MRIAACIVMLTWIITQSSSAQEPLVQVAGRHPDDSGIDALKRCTADIDDAIAGAVEAGVDSQYAKCRGHYWIVPLRVASA